MDNNGNKISNVTIPCLIIGVLKMLIVARCNESIEL